MPIYEYKCKDCGAKFEVLVYSNDAKIVCDKCGSENSERLISGFASAIKGATSGASCSTDSRFT
jgi:putative FmdB family regulatory protein